MKRAITIIVISFLIFSCNNPRKHNDDKNYNQLINGKWSYESTQNEYRRIITFKNGKYTSTEWYDNLVIDLNGKYFINENKQRLTITLTLVPNLKYLVQNLRYNDKGDTIMPRCENIDIISITDSSLIIKRPTEWIRNSEGEYVKKDSILIYKKVK